MGEQLPSHWREEDPSSLFLWAESPDEARTFLEKRDGTGAGLDLDRIFVAKKSPRSRSNKYAKGEYLLTSDDYAVDTFEGETIDAPKDVVKLVQRGTPDVMLSRGSTPLVVVEDTTHLVRMNLYQRIPRLAEAASLGIPNIVLQGTRKMDFSKRGDCWGMYRYLHTFDSIAERHPSSPSLPFYYLPEDDDKKRAERQAFRYIEAVVTGDNKTKKDIESTKLSEIENVMEEGFGEADPAPLVPSIQPKGSTVNVKIGANPEAKSWRTKGSGQMDTYIGMILAAKYKYCYDEKGNKVKPLYVDFTELPEGFFYFEDWKESDSIYKTLPFEIGDEVRFLG